MSVVFADLAGLTALAERLDAQDVARIQDRYVALAAAAVRAHAGTLEKYIGDAVMATFGASRAQDDDVERAVRAALQMVEATTQVARELGLAAGTLHVRVGVNTGEVVVTGSDEGWRVTGDTVNTASRLQSAAEPDQVLLGPETAFGVAHVFVVEPYAEVLLRGTAEPLQAWRVVAARAEPRRRLDLHGLRTTLVGRAEELAVLEGALDADGPGALLVEAPPGVGKTRLVEAFVDRARELGHPCWVVRLVDETERGYTPVARLLQAALGPPADRDLEHLLTDAGHDPRLARAHAARTAALLAGDPLDAEPADLFPAWTAVLDAAAEGRSPVWLVEDLHLAGPGLLAFLRHAVDHAVTPRLVLLTVRPVGLHDAAPRLPEVPVLHLAPLPDDVTRGLVARLVGDGVVPDAYLAGIVTSAGGNPLYVNELLRSWIQFGVLSPVDGTWQFTSGPVRPAVPSTVHAIYQGQLDALPHRTREVVERGSVPGTAFPADALHAMGAEEPDAPLHSLTRAGLLIGPHAAPGGGDAYTFRHALLRDTVYGSLPRQHRAELHARFARWLQELVGDIGAAELIGTHLAAAVRSVPATAAGLEDGTPADRLAGEAASWLEQAGEHLLVSSPERAAQLLSEALDVVGHAPEDPDALRRQLLLAEALRRSGQLEPALRAFSAAGTAALDNARDEALLTAALGYENVLFASRLPRDLWGARSLQLLRVAETRLPPDALAARSAVLAALGRALVHGGDATDGATTCERAVVLAERASDPGALARALLAARAAQDGPSHLPDRLRDGERIAAAASRTGDPELALEAGRLRLVDLLEAGDMVAADAAQDAATALTERLARPSYSWYPPMWRAMRALLAGTFGQAAGLIEDFRVVGHRVHYSDVDLVWAIQRLRLHLDTTGLDQVLDVVRRLAEADPTRWAFAPALVLARLARVREAHVYFDHYVADGFATVVPDLSWTTTMAHLAETAALLGHAPSADRIARLLSPWAGHNLVLGSGALCLGSASHYVGIALRTTGDLDAARRYLSDAVGQNDALGAAALAARSRAELARTLARGGDGAGARTLAVAASHAAHRLGMTDLTRELDADLAALPVPPHPRGRHLST